MKEGINSLSTKLDSLDGVSGMISEISPGNVVVKRGGKLVTRPLCQEIPDTSSSTGLTRGLFYYTPDGKMYYLNTEGVFV